MISKMEKMYVNLDCQEENGESQKIQKLFKIEHFLHYFYNIQIDFT